MMIMKYMMVNFKLGKSDKDEIFNMARAWDKGKKKKSARPVFGRSWVRFPSGTQIFPMSHRLVSCRLFHL